MPYPNTDNDSVWHETHTFTLLLQYAKEQCNTNFETSETIIFIAKLGFGQTT